jgi:hypothetical protein
MKNMKMTRTAEIGMEIHGLWINRAFSQMRTAQIHQETSIVE